MVAMMIIMILMAEVWLVWLMPSERAGSCFVEILWKVRQEIEWSPPLTISLT